MKDLKQMDFFPSTSSQEDTLANLSPLQVEKKVKKIQDTSGQKCLDLSKNSDLLGSLEKMLVDTLNLVSIPYLRTWRVKVTPQGRLVFQLRASVRTTKEKGYGLLPTPMSSDGTTGSIIGKDDQFRVTKNGTLRKVNRNGVDGSIGLGRLVQLWRTPDAHIGRGPSSKERMTMKLEKGMPSSFNDQVAHPNLMWPTPTAVSRPNEGNIRMLRKKVMLGEISREEAEQMVGKDVFEQQGKVPKMMWPTPRASAAMNENLDTVEKRVRKKGKLGAKLEESVATERWPTPTARDYKDSGENMNYKKAAEKGRLPGVIVESRSTQTGKDTNLNPHFVEEMMGYPIGWTDLDH